MDWEEYSSKRIKTGKDGDSYGPFFENPSNLIIGVLIFIFVIGAISSFYRVETQEKAVVTRLGRYLTTSGPGLHFKLPFGIDKVFKAETTVVLEESFGFLSGDEAIQRSNNNYFSSSRSKRSRNTDAESLMLTGDLNVADVEWVVQYKISNLEDYLFNIRDPRKNVRDVSEAVMRRVVGDMTVQDVITRGRISIASQAQELTQKTLDKYQMGIEVKQVLLQDINPPEKVKPAFNEVNSAKQEQEQAINVAEGERNRLIPEARGKAEQEISRAQGYALEVVNKAKGDAERFSQTLVEYKKSPEVTRTRLYLDLMSQVLERSEAVTVIDPEISGVLPVYTSKSALK